MASSSAISFLADNRSMRSEPGSLSKAGSMLASSSTAASDWVQDGTRESREQREEMHQLTLDMVRDSGSPHVEGEWVS